MTSQEPPPEPSTIRLLHVDDEAGHLDFVKVFLEMADEALTVESVTSPEATLALLKEETFDCIVSDFQMPRMNGIEMARKVRETSDIPFIIYTGRGSEEVAEAAFTVGIDDYLRKETDPSHYRVLAMRVRHAVERHRAEAEVQSLARFPSENSNPVLRVSKDGEILYANAAASPFLEEWGSKIGDTVPDKWAEWVSEAHVSDLIEERETVHGERVFTFTFVPVADTEYVNLYGRDVTEQKRQEEELQRSEARFRQFFENEPAYCYMISPDGKIVDINVSALNTLGYEKDEVLGKPLLTTVYSPSSQEKAKELFEKWRETGELRDEELKIVTKGGEERTVLLSVSAIRDAEGKILHSISTQTDITERKRMDEELERSEELYRTLLESGMDGVSLIIDNKLEYVNKRFSEMLGYDDPAELIGRKSIELPHSVSKNRLRDIKKRRKKGYKGLLSYGLEMLRKDGSSIPVEVLSSVINYRGTPATIAFTRDITERKQIEDALRENEERYRALVENSPSSISVTIGNEIVYVNRKRAELTGHTRYELIGTNAIDHIAPKDVELIRGRIKARDSGEEVPDILEFEMMAKGGKRVRVIDHSSNIRWQGSDAVIHMLQDVTDRREMEEALERSEFELRTFIQGVPDHILSLDRDLNISYLNYASPELTVEEMIGEPLHEYAPEEQRPHVLASLNSVLETGEPTRYDTFYDHPGGRIYYETHAVPRKVDDEIVGLIVSARDITDRKRMEKELQASEEKYESLLESAMDAILVNDEEHFLYANANAAKLLGVEDPSMIVGRRFVDFFAPEYRELLSERARERLAGTEPPSRYSFTMLREDGTRVEVEANLSVVDFEGKKAGLAVVRDITENQRLMEALKISEEKYRALLDEGLDGIAVILDGEILYVNQHLAKLLGYSNSSELLGMKNIEIVDPRDKERLASFTKRRRKGERQRFQYEARLLGKDGSSIWMDIASSGIEFEGKQAVIAYARDISERKRMEGEVQRSEARLRLLMDTTTDFFYLYDSNMNLLDVNDAGMIIFPHEPGKEEVLGKNMLELIPGLEGTGRYEKYREVMETGNPVSYDSFKVHPSVGDIEIAVNAFKVGDDLGIHSYNLTEQRIIEKRFEILHNHAADLASATTLDEIVEKTFEAIGKTLEANIGSFHIVEGDTVKPIYSQYPKLRDLDAVSICGPGIVARTVSEGASQLVPDTRADPDYIGRPGATEIELLSELTVPVHVDERVQAVINIESEELEAFNINDQRLVEILAIHVSTAIERIQAQQRLNDLNEQHSRELIEGVQRVSSMVRHDLRGPLQTIMNAAYLAQSDPKRIEEMMALITENVKHQSEIMEDWKSQSLDETLNIAEEDLSRLIADSLATSLIPPGVTVEVAADPVKARLDKVKMRRVMGNLIRNGIEAMEGGGSLRISAREDEDTVVIEVADTGIGIPESEMGNIFKPFHTTKPRGVGLGLTYCKLTVEAHGGTIKADSTIGEGTKLTISLPRTSD